jgi:hypothetical protein
MLDVVVVLDVEVDHLRVYLIFSRIARWDR